jgi:hypothetical protein
MTERKLGLFEGILTDLKIMMDAAPFASGPPTSDYTFGSSGEPITPEYLNAISGPVPLERDEMEEVDYQQTLEQAFENAKDDSSPYRMLHVDDSNLGSAVPLISVTKLSPDLDSMTVKELLSLAKEQSVSVPAGTRRKDIIDILKKKFSQQVEQKEELTGPVPTDMGSSIEEVTL